METDNISTIKYNPSQALSIDDISKIMYNPNRDVYLKAFDAIANTVGNVQTTGNAIEDYINSLEYLPDDKNAPDKEKLIEDLNNTIYSKWDSRTSPDNLRRVVSEFGKRVSPSGDIGKAATRYRNTMAWMDVHKDALNSLPDDQRDKLVNEFQNKMISMDNTAEMNIYAFEHGVAKLPDFNKILSNDALKAIENYAEQIGDTYMSQGLREDYAVGVINGIIRQDEDINKWIEQYNRINGTNYTIDNCITGYDGNGNVRTKNLPPELKAAVNDAWYRAIEGKFQYKPVKIPTDGMKDYKYGGGGGDDKKNSAPHLQTTKNIVYGNNYGDMDYLLKHYQKDLFPPGFILARDVEFENFITDKKDNYENPILGDLKIGKYNEATDSYPVFSDKNLIGYTKNPNNLNEIKSNISKYFRYRNDVVNESVFVTFKTKIDKKEYKDFVASDFDILTVNENGSYEKSDIKKDPVKYITGISLASPFGDIMFTGGDDDNNTYILIPKKIDNLSETCRNILDLSENLDPYTKFFLENSEYIELASMLSRSIIKRDDNNGRFYKEIPFSYKNLKECGINNVPLNFWNCRLRMYLRRKDNANDRIHLEFVNSDGDKISNVELPNLNSFFGAFGIYMSRYENPKDLKEGKSLAEYYSDRLYGIDINDETDLDFEPEEPGRQVDFDPYTEGIQTPFPKRDENLYITEAFRNKYGEFAQIETLLKNVKKDNPTAINSTDYCETELHDDGKYYIQGIGGDSVCVGDIMKRNGEYYIILPYGNGYVLVDRNGDYAYDLTSTDLTLRDNFFKGKYRGNKIG